MSSCHVCEATTTHGLAICGVHREVLLGALARVPDLVDDLVTTMSRQDRVGPSSLGGKSAEKPLAFHVGAAQSLRRLTDVLTDWETAVLPRADVSERPQQAAESLALAIDQVAGRDDVNHFYDDIGVAVADAIAVIDLPRDRGRYLGRCGFESEDGATCWVPLFAPDDRDTVDCPGCGARWNATERRVWLMQIVENDLTGSARDIADWLAVGGRPIALSSVLRWIGKKTLLPLPDLPGARPRYAYSDAVAVYDARKRTGTKAA